jgi:hypothetical protein
MNPPLRKGHLALRAAAAALGAAAALVLLVGSGAVAGGPPHYAAAGVSAAPTGELAVSPATRPFLSAPSLRPGGAAVAGTFTVRNQTGSTLSVSFRARPDSTLVDGLLRVRVRSAGRTLAATTLQGLRRGTAPLRMAPGATRRVTVSVSLAADAALEQAGGAVAVLLAPRSAPLGGGA